MHEMGDVGSRSTYTEIRMGLLVSSISLSGRMSYSSDRTKSLDVRSSRAICSPDGCDDTASPQTIL